MPDIDVADLGAVLGELAAGWWRVDLRGDHVDSSPSVAALLGFPEGHVLTPDEIRAEHAAEAPEAPADAHLLQDILAIQPAMVARYRADGCVEWCNEAYAAHFLRTPPEVVGSSWVDLGVEYGHDSREGLEATLAAVVEHASSSPATVVAPLIGSVATGWFQWTNRRAVAPSDGRDVPAADAERGAALIREAIDHLRACLGDLTSPPVLPGLLIDHIAADVEAVRIAGAEVHLWVDDVPREEIRTVAARVIAEGLRNVVRHADAGRVDVRLELRGDVVTGTVVDDGVGADVNDVSRALAAGHIGLLVSRALVESIGGTFTLGRNRPRGTALKFELPLHR